MNETVCPSTQKFPLPSNELLPVSQITLANTEADGNKNCNSILDPIVESDMVETVRAEISSALQDDTSKRGRKVLASKVGAKAGSFKAGEVGVATGTNRVSRANNDELIGKLVAFLSRFNNQTGGEGTNVPVKGLLVTVNVLVVTLKRTLIC